MQNVNFQLILDKTKLYITCVGQLGKSEGEWYIGWCQSMLTLSGVVE